ncbi:hypothetical protein G4B88_029457 [Cannabis sativa]|uniref:Protein-tyrosine-phosphatase MKP1 C-terminal domain-containing protein n=1 Tax=Cannabis sativa TaxID=3483 RepID=A0A7J6HDK6_CANSA|nr:hypothetical protein G4B88_029457 [Cannabis sativa]
MTTFGVNDLDSRATFAVLSPNTGVGKNEERVLYVWVGRSADRSKCQLKLGSGKGSDDLEELDWNHVGFDVLIQMGLPKGINIKIVKEDEEPAEFLAMLKMEKQLVVLTLGSQIIVYQSGEGMPNMLFLYGMDFIEVLKKKHAAGTYRKMVIYVEACESGSIFEGIMPKDMNIYVTTASNAQENSLGTYCPEMEPPPPPEYITCLGDLYSVAWMEDSQGHNLKRETIKQQYEMVKERTANANDFVNGGSHVMEYGSRSIRAEKLYLYQKVLILPLLTSHPTITNYTWLWKL